MGTRCCPKCLEVVDVKVMVEGYSQGEILGFVAKRRRVKHRVEDGGCGHEWITYELPEEVFDKMGIHADKTHGSES